MPEDEPKKDVVEHVSNWLKAFWWSRGVFAAISIIALAPNVIDMSRYELLRAVHAAILAWNEIAGAIGAYIAELISIPKIPATVVNFLLYFTTIVAPWLYAGSKDLRERRALEKQRELERKELLQSIISAKKKIADSEFDADLRRVARESLEYLEEAAKEEPSYTGIISTFPKKHRPWIRQFTNASGELLMIIAPATALTVTYLLVFVPSIFGTETDWLSILILILWLSLFVYAAMKHLPGYLRGLITVISFLLCLEVLYWLQTPYLTNAINNFACEHAADPDDEDCKEKPDIIEGSRQEN